jgi:hypothetical protein
MNTRCYCREGGGVMKGIVEYLEEATWRGKVVQKASMRMEESHAWFHPLLLEQGIEYMIRVKGCRNVKRVNCAIADDCGSIVVHEVTGRTPRLFVVPERAGVHKVMVTVELSHRAETAGKVGVTLLKEYLPWRARNGLFGWSGSGRTADLPIEVDSRKEVETRFFAASSHPA